jgi:hypothetical protein
MDMHENPRREPAPPSVRLPLRRVVTLPAEVPILVAPPSQLAAVTACVALGLAMQGGGDALAREGIEGPALPLFFVGLMVIFIPCAWRLLGEQADRSERLRISVVLGLGLLVSYILRSPLIFDGFDELLHQGTLTNLLDLRTLFTPNTVLPVSPYYPGLELLTIAVKWLTGLPLVAAQIVVLAGARLLIVLCVFLTVERITHSAYAGGVAVLVYAASPQFYSFNAQFAYETLALALAAATVQILFAEVEHPSARTGRRVALALACVVAAVVTHHVTGWILVVSLCVWAAALWRGGARRGARVVGVAAGTGVAAVGIWTAFVGDRLLAYLGPLFSSALSGIASVFGSMQANRALFTDASGAASPTWEVVVMLAAAAAWCLILLPSLRAGLARRTVGSGRLRFLPLAIAACYPLTLVARLSSSSSEIGDRATAFVFLAVALVVAAWLMQRPRGPLSPRERKVATSVAGLCFLGSMILGSGPDWSYVPGPYLVGADNRSIGAPSLGAALWVGSHLPAGSRIAADRDNGALLDAFGHVDPVTAIGGTVNVGPIYFSATMGSFQLALVRQAKIRYLLVDDRLASGPPQFGVYFEPGETAGTERLTAADLDKFSSVPGIRRIYDDGPIQIYDLASLLGLPATSPESGTTYGQPGTTPDWPVLGLAVAVLLAWGWRLRRGPPASADAVVRVVAAAMVAGIAFGFAAVPAGVAPHPLAVVVLLCCGALSFWPEVGDTAPVARRVRRPVLVAVAGLLLAGAVAAAVIPARQEWVPPAEMSLLYTASGRPVLEVELGSGSAVASQVEVLSGGEVVFQQSLDPTASDQVVPLPTLLRAEGATVRLVAGGRVIRSVQG